MLLKRGSRGDGYIVTKTYDVPIEGFPSLSDVFEPSDQERLQLEVMNVTLPAALMLLDPEKYPTQSRARKAIRQRAICICRRNSDSKFDELGKVIARAYPGDIIGLDRPTSGLVVVAKTKLATVHLSQQFEFRKAQKTYMAILNGSPQQPNSDNEDGWNLIDHDLEDKSAVTKWKVLQTVKSLHGNNGVLTLVELKPKTGRYHQLRRHMAWVCKAPIVGDATYDEDNMRLRKRGLFLCSNEITIEHPYYNTPSGREEWSQLKKDTLNLGEGCLLEEDEESGIVTLRVRIDLPKKFASFLMHEDARANKFLNETE
ncbi:RNA pseudouridine synthase [Skeletonema marinoi]|uniref:RNA pseudouridine synthase n=1 Tax=Skeletonema marinoi TaxID=267567 RepID=A0AAD8YHB6_9STRA|nr:RNA pseudouridine synthase [Skeletonema marinoi]